ncbi:MAG: TonB-dependent receptor, partial [Deltaproteobacteria bacterium]
IPFSLFAQTQTETEEATLEEVVVTATRDVEEIRKIPANVTVITKDAIERSNAQTVTELMKDEVGVVVRDFYGTGKTASVDIRGFGETRPLNTLVLVDGRRVNEIDLSGVDWTQIPLDQVERIEIVRGSGSVLYGDNAAGGVINIITKKPQKTFSAGAEAAGGSYGFQKGSGFVSGKWGPLSAILNASYSSMDGYRENGFLRTRNAGGKILYDLTEAITLDFSGNLHSDNAGLPSGLTKAEIIRFGRRATLHPDDHAETDDGYGSFGMKARLWDFGRIEAELSYRNRDVADSFISFNFSDQRSMTTWGFTPRYILDKPIWDHRNKLTLGVDFYKSKSEMDSRSGIGPNPEDVLLNHAEITKKSLGFYILDEFSILENLVLSAGFRQERVTFDLFQESPFLKDSVKENEPAWNFGLDYLFGKKSSAFLSYKRSFRFPVSDELVQFVFIPPNLEARVNPAIKPQTGNHYEAGVRHAFTNQIEGSLTFFRIDLKDEIFFNPFTFTNENIPKTRRQGLEAGMRARPFPWLTLWGNYTYTRARLEEDILGFDETTVVANSGNGVPGVPRHKGSLGSDVELGKGFLWNSRINIVGARRFISDFANKVENLDGYYTLDTRLSYTWKGLRAFVGVNNLFNQKFAEFAVVDSFGKQVFYPSPERNFIGGISYTF